MVEGGSSLAALAPRQPFAFAPPILAPVTIRCPKVSVLVTSYNMGRFIVEAVHSALSQSYGNLEIIICDDGSEDDSLARLEASFKNNSRIAYFAQPNAGQAGAMNAAFVRATGDLITFLDADDVWLPDRMRRVVEQFTASSGLGILSHQLRAVDEKLRPLRFVAPGHFDVGWLGWDPLAVAGLSKARTTGLTVHREVADRVFPLPIGSRGHGDGVMVRRAAVLARVGALHEVHALYRQHDGNQTGITGPTSAKVAAAELQTRRIAFADHVAFYCSAFGRPAWDENFVRRLTAYDELTFDLLAGRPLDRQLIGLLPRRRTRGWWFLLAALPRTAAIASFRFRRRQPW
jgi:hypothetical protein